VGLLHFVDIGLDRMHHGSGILDPKHVQFEPGMLIKIAIPEIIIAGSMTDWRRSELRTMTPSCLLFQTTAPTTGWRFCHQRVAHREGLLVLNEYPKNVTSSKN